MSRIFGTEQLAEQLRRTLAETLCSAFFKHCENVTGMELYVYEDYKDVIPGVEGRELTDALIVMSLEASGLGRCQVERTDKGKPYIRRYDKGCGSVCGKDRGNGEGCDRGHSVGHGGNCGNGGDSGADGEIHVSASHSGRYFLCLVSDSPVGVDVQQERRTAAEKISARYFTDREQQYVRKNGDDGFFRLWTRKEAYSKYTGLGMEEIMKGTEVVGRDDVEFFDFQLEKGIYCSCCMMIRTEEKDI